MSGRLLKRIIQKVTTKMNESNRLQQYRDHLVAFQHYHSLRDCKHILLLTHSLLTLNNHMVKNRNIVHFNLISSIKHIAKSINIELDLYILHSLSMPGTDSMMDIKASLIIELNNNISK